MRVIHFQLFLTPTDRLVHKFYSYPTNYIIEKLRQGKPITLLLLAAVEHQLSGHLLSDPSYL